MTFDPFVSHAVNAKYGLSDYKAYRGDQRQAQNM